MWIEGKHFINVSVFITKLDLEWTAKSTELDL